MTLSLHSYRTVDSTYRRPQAHLLFPGAFIQTLVSLLVHTYEMRSFIAIYYTPHTTDSTFPSQSCPCNAVHIQSSRSQILPQEITTRRKSINTPG